MENIRGWSTETAWVQRNTGNDFGGFFTALAEKLENGIKHIMGQPCNDTSHERTARVTQIKMAAEDTRRAFYPEDPYCCMPRRKDKLRGHIG